MTTFPMPLVPMCIRSADSSPAQSINGIRRAYLYLGLHCKFLATPDRGKASPEVKQVEIFNYIGSVTLYATFPHKQDLL